VASRALPSGRPGPRTRPAPWPKVQTSVGYCARNSSWSLILRQQGRADAAAAPSATRPDIKRRARQKLALATTLCRKRLSRRDAPAHPLHARATRGFVGFGQDGRSFPARKRARTRVGVSGRRFRSTTSHRQNHLQLIPAESGLFAMVSGMTIWPLTETSNHPVSQPYRVEFNG